MWFYSCKVLDVLVSESVLIQTDVEVSVKPTEIH